MKKLNSPIEFEHIALKLALYVFAAMVAAALFMPQDGKMRNPTLLFTLIIILCLLFVSTAFRKIMLLLKVKRQFLKKGAENIRLGISPFASLFKGRYTLSCTFGGVYYIALIILRKNAWTSYHFESSQRIEYYKTTRSATRTNKVRGSVSRGEVYTRCVGTRNLRWGNLSQIEQSKKFIVFNKTPINITSAKFQGSVESGMEIDTNTFVCDGKTFEKYIK